MNILIVDDDKSVRNAIQEYLTLAKFHSSTVSSAEKALEYLRIHDVDVVITDILLDGLNGLELTDIINREHDADVIVITGYSSDYSYEEAVSKGASDFVFKPVRFEELLLRLKRVIRERTLTKDRIQMMEKLKKLVITDSLTRLYNSRHFYNQLELEVDRQSRYKHPLSLLLLDIDFFKQYNDNFGHLEGDKVLTRIGKVIKACLRKMDTGYRYGGEEFTIILPETDSEEAVIVAERVQECLSQEIFLSLPGETPHITLSIGVTEYLKNEELSQFIQRADKAMYRSKANGRDRITVLHTD